jgi:hypothetical protein
MLEATVSCVATGLAWQRQGEVWFHRTQIGHLGAKIAEITLGVAFGMASESRQNSSAPLHAETRQPTSIMISTRLLVFPLSDTNSLEAVDSNILSNNPLESGCSRS